MITSSINFQHIADFSAGAVAKTYKVLAVYRKMRKTRYGCLQPKSAYKSALTRLFCFSFSGNAQDFSPYCPPFAVHQKFFKSTSPVLAIIRLTAGNDGSTLYIMIFNKYRNFTNCVVIHTQSA